MYREYHKNDLHAITSRLRGHLPLLGNKDLDINIGGKGGQNGVKSVYDPVGLKTWILNTSIWPIEHIQANKKWQRVIVA